MVNIAHVVVMLEEASDFRSCHYRIPRPASLISLERGSETVLQRCDWFISAPSGTSFAFIIFMN